MFNRSFVESDSPVRRIIADGSRYLKCSRKFCVNTYFFRCIQIFCKSSFNTLFSRTIRKHIILNCFFCKERLIKALRVFFGCKDCAIVFSFNSIVRNMIYNHCSFLLIDKPDNLCNKFFRIISKHIEFFDIYAL